MNCCFRTRVTFNWAPPNGQSETNYNLYIIIGPLHVHNSNDHVDNFHPVHATLWPTVSQKSSRINVLLSIYITEISSDNSRKWNNHHMYDEAHPLRFPLLMYFNEILEYWNILIECMFTSLVLVAWLVISRIAHCLLHFIFVLVIVFVFVFVF